MMRSGWTAELRWFNEPDIAAWVAQSRLNLLRSLPDHIAEPAVQDAVGRFFTNVEAAGDRLKRLEESGSP